MRIHQLNIRYESDQDRLLARVNTDTGVEIRLWLTRRLTVGLLPLMRKLVHEQTERHALANAGIGAARDPHVRQALSDFKKETSLRQSDFKTPFKEAADPVSLVEPALLIGEVTLTPLANGKLQTIFKGPTGDKEPRREIKLELDSHLMHGFLHLLEKAYLNSQWAQAGVTPMEAEAPHEPGTSESRPQYLN